MIDKRHKPGMYLSETTMLCDGAGIHFAALGCQAILWTTGCAGFNNPIVPVIRVSGNENLINEDIDIDASGIMRGKDSIEAVSENIIDCLDGVLNGEEPPSKKSVMPTALFIKKISVWKSCCALSLPEN